MSVAGRQINPAPRVADRAAPVMELNLHAGDRLRPTLGWISDQDLLATAMVSTSSPAWDTRVVHVNLGSRKVNEVVPQGMLLCTAPASGLAGLLVGSLARGFAGVQTDPPARETLFTFNRALQNFAPAPEAEHYNAWICRKVAEAHRRGSLQGRKLPVAYLEERHGVLRFPAPMEAEREPVAQAVVLERNGSSRPVDLRPDEVLNTPEFMPFRDAYLIAAGSTLAEAFYRDEKGEAQQETPIITMTPGGKVTRENPRGALARAGLVVDALVRPYREGLLVISHAALSSGGGIYTFNPASTSGAGELRRVWCTGKTAASGASCKIEQFALSPNGCQLAFFAKGPAQENAPAPNLATLRVLDLCRAGPR